MCGIAGILYKSLAEGRNQTTGQALIDMLDGCQHRGPDSTGFALYGDATDDQLRLRFFIGSGDEAAAAIGKIKEILDQHQAEILEDEVIGNNYRVVVNFSGEMWKMAYDLEHVAKVISIGTSLEIIKDVGSAHDVDDTYHVQSYSGTHGLGHVRLATESDVKPEAAHPFWATGFSRHRYRPQRPDHQLLEDAPPPRAARLRVPYRQRQRADRRLSGGKALPGRGPEGRAEDLDR